MQKKKKSMALFFLSFFIGSTHINKAHDNIYQDAFKDLLLVVHFNWPYYGNIEFLKNLYSPVFKNIVFYGEQAAPGVFAVASHEGYYIGEFLQDVFTRFPQYKGYLIVQDDCIVNFWNFLTLDKNKIWYAPKFNGRDNFNIVRLKDGKHLGGYFWEGWERVLNGTTRRADTKEAYKQLTAQDKAMLAMNIGKDNIASHFVDFYYIPGRYAANAKRLAGIFRNVFCEIAALNILLCLDDMRHWEKLTMLWGIGQTPTGMLRIAPTNYPTGYHWIHPVKCSSPENRATLLSVFNKVLTR